MELWLLFLSSFTSATILPGSSEVMLTAMIVENTWDKWQLLLFATAGNVLGSIVTFYMGYFVYTKKPINISTNKRRQRVYAVIKKWGCYSLLLSWLPVFGDVFCLLAGWLRLPSLSAILAIFIGKLIRYSVLIWFITEVVA